MYYYLARDRKTGYAVGVYKTHESVFIGTAAFMVDFEMITKAEYETYIEFGMYQISSHDTFGKLVDMAKKRI